MTKFCISLLCVSLALVTTTQVSRAHLVDFGTRGLHGNYEPEGLGSLQIDGNVLFIPYTRANFLLAGIGGGWKWFDCTWFMFKSTLDLGLLSISGSPQAFHDALPRDINIWYLYTGLNLSVTFRINIYKSFFYPITLGFVLPAVLSGKVSVFDLKTSKSFVDENLLSKSIFLVPIPYLQILGLSWE